MTILIADDHAILRAGLKALIEQQPDLRVVAEAADGREAIAQCQRHNPEVVIMDLAMPGLNGIEAIRQLKAPVVVLSMHSDESYVLRALKAGARGYVLKEAAESELIAALRAVASGEQYFSPRIQLTARQPKDSYDLLTAREREILQLIGEGLANKEIAARLFLSVHTVETHRSNVLEKLDLHSTPDLILYAIRR